MLVCNIFLASTYLILMLHEGIRGLAKRMKTETKPSPYATSLCPNRQAEPTQTETPRIRQKFIIVQWVPKVFYIFIPAVRRSEQSEPTTQGAEKPSLSVGVRVCWSSSIYF